MLIVFLYEVAIFFFMVYYIFYSFHNGHTVLLKLTKRGCMHAQLLQSCLTLEEPINCGQPGSCIHGILQARILERVAMPSSRGSSQLEIETTSPAFQTDSLPTEPPGSHEKEEGTT